MTGKAVTLLYLELVVMTEQGVGVAILGAEEVQGVRLQVEAEHPRHPLPHRVQEPRAQLLQARRPGRAGVKRGALLELVQVVVLLPQLE